MFFLTRFPSLSIFLLVSMWLAISGCGTVEEEAATSADASREEASSPAPAVAPVTASDEPLVVFLGDSLTAGYGLDEEQAYPRLLEDLLARQGRAVRIVNAGVSGDTTAGGLRRIEWLLRQRPDILFVCLGGNDGLRGIDLDSSQENLRQIIRQAQAAGARVMLAGMQLPPNYGPQYTEKFAAMYPLLTAELDVYLMPFLLTGVAAVPELNQADGIHPNADGQQRVAQEVLPHLIAVLDELAAAS